MRSVKEQSERSQHQTDVVPSLNREILSNVCFLPMTLSPKVALNIVCAIYAVLPQVQNKASDKCTVSSNHPVTQRRSQLTRSNINTHSEVMHSKLDCIRRATLLHLLSYKLCYLPFSALVVSSGTAECAVLCIS